MTVHHVDLVVGSLERSVPFYRDLLEPLGYTRIADIVGERGETVRYIGGGGTAIGLREAQSDGSAFDRYRLGVHHVAFEAPSREAVDERFRWASERAEIESPPKEYDYMPGYYAFFFYDPDGLKLEVVHVPRR